MSIKRFSAKTPAKLMTKYPGNNALARIGHVNEVIDAINDGITGSEVGQIPYPFEWWPNASIINTGTEFQYQPWEPGTEGVKLTGALLKGTWTPSNNSGLSDYITTLRITYPNLMAPSFFPGEITGMIQVPTVEGGTIVLAPLASGSHIGFDSDDEPVYIHDFGFSLIPYQYGEEELHDGYQEYALLATGAVKKADGTPSSVNSQTIVSYNFKLLAVNDSVITNYND